MKAFLLAYVVSFLTSFVVHFLVLMNVAGSVRKIKFGRFILFCFLISSVISGLAVHHGAKSLVGCLVAAIPYVVLSLLPMGFIGYSVFLSDKGQR